MRPDLLTDVVVRELQNVHSEKTAACKQGANAGSENAQVLGDKRQRSEFLECTLEQLDARSRHPGAIGSGTSCGNRKIVMEAQEVIETHAVVQLERAAQTGKPPYVSVFAHMIPVVGGIAPNLSGG